MAKEFYSLDEAADVLGVSKADVDQMVNDGRLQAYDEDGQTVFKIEDIEGIVAKEGSSIVDLDLGSPEAKADEPELAVPEPTSDINLLGLDESSVDLDLGPSPVVPAAPKAPPKPQPPPAPVESLTEGSSISLADSSELDIGLSASDVIALDEAVEKPGKSGSGLRAPGKGKEDSRVASGVSVFDEGDLHTEADPLAKTTIAPVADDELQMAMVGSGSGLLDLPRESDDTSLGAELLDVISPSEGTETETAAETIESDTGTLEAEAVDTSTASDAMTVEEGEAEPAAAAAPAMVMVPADVVHDPYSPAFTGLAVVAMASLCVAGLATTSQIQGVWPGFMKLVDSGMNLYIFMGALLLLAGAAWMIGWMVGKPAAPRKPKPAKAPKPPKAEKKKK